MPFSNVVFLGDKNLLSNSHPKVKEILMLSSKKIKGRREMADLSQEQAGKLLGLSRPTYARREALGKFSTAELQVLAGAFGCRPSDLKDVSESNALKIKAERDGQLEAMRELISSLRSENETLREMIDMLRSQANQSGQCPLLSERKTG